MPGDGRDDPRTLDANADVLPGFRGRTPRYHRVISLSACETSGGASAGEFRLLHRGQWHDESCIDEALEVRRKGPGKGPVSDEDACVDVAVECVRREVRGGDEDLLSVMDDRHAAIVLVILRTALGAVTGAAHRWRGQGEGCPLVACGHDEAGDGKFRLPACGPKGVPLPTCTSHA